MEEEITIELEKDNIEMTIENNEKITIHEKYDDTEIRNEISEIKQKNVEQDERLGNIKNYDDTEIKSEIAEIKQNNIKQDKAIENKVDKEEGKGLTTNDFTNTYKEKLDSISELGGYDDTIIQNKIEKLKKENELLKAQIPTRTS